MCSLSHIYEMLMCISFYVESHSPCLRHACGHKSILIIHAQTLLLYYFQPDPYNSQTATVIGIIIDLHIHRSWSARHLSVIPFKTGKLKLTNKQTLPHLLYSPLSDR